MDFKVLANLDPYSGRVQDSFIEDSRESDYKETAKTLNENFYAQLLVKLQSILANTKKAKDFTGSQELKVLGNNLRFLKKGDVLKLYVNGQSVLSDEGVDESFNIKKVSAQDICQRVATSEIEGKIEIVRPEGRNLIKDRLELSPKNLKKSGLVFPKQLSDKLKTDADTGKEMPAAKQGQLKQRDYLNKKNYDFGIREGILNEEDYEQLGESFFKKGVVLRLGNLPNTDIYNTDEIIARSKNGEEYEKRLDLGKDFFVSLNGNVYRINRNQTVEEL